VLDVVRDIEACSLGHRGVLLDFGDASLKDDLHPGSVGHGDDEIVEHEGATWLRIRSRALSSSFTWPAFANETPDPSIYVEVRLRAVIARGLSLSIDGKTVGTLTLVRAAPRVVLARTTAPLTLPPGAHELTMRFIGGPRASEEPLAEVDWVHVGTGDPTEPYAAPTRADVVTDATVGGRSLRALSLRAPGFVRCATWVPANATIEASLATAGGGDADIEARLVRDRRPPVILGAAHVSGGATSWAPWSVPVTGLEGDGALASLELVVKRATKGTRVLLGEPRAIVADSIASASSPPPPVRNALVVVLGNTAAKSLAPWGGPHAVPELTKLTATGTTFLANRASSSLASSVLATLLTGLPARLHGVDDPNARLPRGPTTLQEACRQGGISAAAFTANPTTGAAFGFDRGWDTFTAHDPLEPSPGTAVFDDAAAWIEGHKDQRFLVVVHARGGHAPWDATPDELRALPPENYLGILEPQRAAEALAKAHRHAGRFKEDDRTRAFALYDHALDAHDSALGTLLSALHASGHDADTLVVVTGDVAPTEGPPVPFVDLETLDEPLLATPLVVRWPGAPALAARRVEAPTSPLDLARTLVSALGLSSVPQAFQGLDLATVARGALVPATRPLAATRGSRFSVRWGQFVLLGNRDHELRMCDLALDAACVADVRATSPSAFEPIHRWAVTKLAPVTPPPYPREPVVLDERTTAALVRWGRPAEEKEAEDEH
jgi:arylsulfatase A-like enzyme